MIFKRLNNFAGPARFVFVDPDTKHLYRARSRPELVSLIVGYRSQNELTPIEHLNLVLENYWCSLPENQVNCRETELKRGFAAYISGGVALLKNLMFKKFATPEQAESRAKICVSCPKNVFPDKDFFMKWSDEVAEQSVGDRKVPQHNELGNCEVCSCVLRGKVWYGGKITYKKKEQNQYPDFCWILKEGSVDGN